MSARAKMIGRRFGRLTCLTATQEKNGPHRIFICRCDCNGRTIQVQGNHLRSGLKAHCGCGTKPRPRHRVDHLRIDPNWEAS